jgi:hypothetical protein
MTLSALPQSAPRIGRLVGGSLFGSVLVAGGLLGAYLTVATPLLSRLVPHAPAGDEVVVGFGVWSFALIAGGALVLSGTSRLAFTLTTLRGGRGVGGAAARALASTPGDVTVVSGVIPKEGAPIPELVIGAFGVAVIHALPTSRQIRSGRDSGSSDGRQPSDDPLASVKRDADRVRRWVSEADLDFVVRVHAALVVSDRTLQRTATCAVITAEQIPAWIASLPRQRTLTAGRRGRLLAMARPSASAQAPAKRDW